MRTGKSEPRGRVSGTDTVSGGHRLPGRASVGHPVDVASGAVFTVGHDFDLRGTMRLLWRRYYSTDSDAQTVLGPRWTTPFLMTLETLPEGWRLIADTGASILFERPERALEVGQRVRNLAANMELWRRADGYTVVHWHPGEASLAIWHFWGTEGVLPLVAIENEAGHRFTFTYDALRRISGLTQEVEGRRLSFAYNPAGQLSAIRLEHEGGPTTLASYTYDRQGMLETAANALGGVTRYAYDASGRMLLEQNPLGSTFHFRYDAQGRCVLTSGDGGREYRTLKFHPGGRRVDVTNGRGHVRQYILNAAGQVLQQISPLGVTTTTEYDELGRITKQINADGTARSHEYDPEGNRVAMTFEDGSTVHMGYNNRHALTSYTDALGNAWTLERNARNQLVGVVNPLGHRFTTVRDERGFVTETTTPLGRRTMHAYGPNLSWMEVGDELGVRFRFDYDVFGNVVAYHDGGGLRQTVRYDLLNNPVEARDALGRTHSWRYNALGEVVEYVSGTGIVERMEYDLFGQLIAHHTAAGTMRLAYDTDGRLTEVINRRGEHCTREYDADGRMIREVQFDGRVERYDYDVRDRLTRRVLSDGEEVAYKYNPLAEVVAIRSPRGVDQQYEYDPRGYLVAATAPGARIECAFDEAGRLTAETQNGHTVETEYDADNFPVGRRVLGTRIGFAYDVRGRLTALSDDDGVYQTIRWNVVNQPEERSAPANVRERLSWTRDDSLLAQVVSAGNEVRVERHYTYDAAGHVSRLSDSGAGQLTYEYDALGRLVTVAGAEGPRESYTYDAIGVITATRRGRREIGPNGRTLSDGEARYAYDETGMLTSVEQGGGGRLQYAYDAHGQLRQATRADGSVVRYAYDALGRRSSRSVGERTTEYVYAGPLLVGERDSTAGDRVFAGIDWYTLAEWRRGERRFVVPDTTYAVREVLDSRGTLAWSGSFEAYGRPRSEQGEAADRHRFPGQYSDASSGLVYNFYREYHSSLGAYVTPDPIGIAGGADLYGYPRNPFLWFDPFGLSPCPGHSAEENMGKYMNSKGYKKISTRGKDLNANGIDGVYMAKDGKGPPLYIIAEAKSSQSGRLGTPASGQQMSDNWIDTGMNAAPPPNDRLTLATDPTTRNAIQAAAQPGGGGVSKVVYHQPGGTGKADVTPLSGPGSVPYNPNSGTTTF